jgi:hypothetical protein
VDVGCCVRFIAYASIGEKNVMLVIESVLKR